MSKKIIAVRGFSFTIMEAILKTLGRKLKVPAFSFFIAVLFCGCATIGGYNAISLEQLTSLKAYHLGLIDNNTQAGNAKKQYDSQKVTAAKETGELKFNEAIEYAQAFKDKLRVDNIVLLKGVFEDDISLIQGKNRLITIPESQLMRAASALAYDEAIKGENSRNKAESK